MMKILLSSVVMVLLMLSTTLLLAVTQAQGVDDTKYRSRLSSNPSEGERPYTETELLAFAAASQKIWNQEKAIYQDSYTHQYRFSSVFGFGTLYTVVVSEGMVVEYIKKSYEYNHTSGERIDHPEEIMTGDEIDRSRARTIDELYELCINDWLPRPTEENYLYLGLSSGHCLLTMCGYFPEGCMDDCYFGIPHFESFAWESMTEDPSIGGTGQTDEMDSRKCSIEDVIAEESMLANSSSSSTAVALLRPLWALYVTFVLAAWCI